MSGPETSDRKRDLSHSCNKLADTTGSGDTLLGNLGELLGADNAGLGNKLALSENLEEALAQIDY